MGARPNLCYEWRGFTNPHPSGWRLSKERLEEEYQKGNIRIRADGKLERRKYERDYRGKQAGNIWTDIPIPMGKERIGWPTQKPLRLYRRIISASTNVGDMVLDAFAGCATTCVAAEQLGRQWVGIDIDQEAEVVTRDRLQRETRLFVRNTGGGSPVLIRRDAPYRKPDSKPQGPIFEPPRRAKRNAPMPPLSEARKYLAQRDGAFCQGCGFIPPKGFLDYLEVDHKLPKADGGTNVYDNLALLCSPCNRRKNHRYTLSGLRDILNKEDRIIEKRW